MSAAAPPGGVLAQIIAHKRREVAARIVVEPQAALERRAARRRDRRPFTDALRQRLEVGAVGVIAEMKRASPSAGVLRADYRPAAIAADYEVHGAAALSVLTDEHFFQGAHAHLEQARNATLLPVLRKDFIIDEYQLYESCALGADCVLLIAAAFTEAPERLAALAARAAEIGLDVLLEVHSAGEMSATHGMEIPLVGINNRDLSNFQTRLETTWELLPNLPPGRLAVTESGIAKAADVSAMRARGVHCFLIGEALMRAEVPGTALRALFGDNLGSWA